MAKPILVIRMNLGYLKEKEEIDKLRDNISNAFDNEYHLFIVSNPIDKDIEFEVYNGEYLDPIKIEELKEIIK